MSLLTHLYEAADHPLVAALLGKKATPSGVTLEGVPPNLVLNIRNTLGSDVISIVQWEYLEFSQGPVSKFYFIMQYASKEEHDKHIGAPASYVLDDRFIAVYGSFKGSKGVLSQIEDRFKAVKLLSEKIAKGYVLKPISPKPWDSNAHS